MIKRSGGTLREDILRIGWFLRYRIADILIGFEFLLLIVLYAIFMISDKVPLRWSF
jgi:hypothetical protein